MLSLEQPWALLALPLPLLLHWLLPAAAPTDPALRAGALPRLRPLAGRPAASRRWLLQWLLPGLAWLCLLGAASAPTWHSPAQGMPVSGREMMLAVDLSGSMQIQDMTLERRRVPRLTVLKHVVRDFLRQREGDRVGLILFGSQAYLQAPLTHDLATLGHFMDEAQIGFAGPETAIGDAIGLAIRHLPQHETAQRRVLILLTDGANNTGQVMPLAAARVAAAEGVVIHTIGFGGDAPLIGMISAEQGGPGDAGPGDIDEDSLRGIAALTGGQYFRARSAAELAQIYQALAELEPIALTRDGLRSRHSLAHWPLAIALLLSAVVALRLILMQGHAHTDRGAHP